MLRRFVSIWFRHLATDWFTLQQQDSVSKESQERRYLKTIPFVLRTLSRGRMVVTAVNAVAEEQGIFPGMVLADARALCPGLKVNDDKPGLSEKLLKRLAEWCIRFTPVVSVDTPDGLFFDATGCPHLWGSETRYLSDIIRRLNERGYNVRAALADTPGVAWAVARFGTGPMVIESGRHVEAILPLPPEALRLDPETTGLLHKLGLHRISQFISMPRPSLRRRFGEVLIRKLDLALGNESEILNPVQPIQPYQERLPCLEPIVTATGIEIALSQLLQTLCHRLQQEQKGIRSASLKCYRVDGNIQKVDIGTNLPSHHVQHLFKLFELKLQTVEPSMGIELFVLEASKVEDLPPKQERMWEGSGGLEDIRLSELLDRLASRTGKTGIHRYLPNEHYWPERSLKPAASLREIPVTSWRTDKLRPLQLLTKPERIEVTAPIPDYPPMLFRYKEKVHHIVKADGPERIEQEWWIQEGQHRDYYHVEDENGNRYWIFRSGHYDEKKYQWYLHGFFA